MRLPFNEAKATQVASMFIRLAGGRLNYMVLIKLMYLADREALLRWGSPVTFDDFYSMHKGPVLSRVLNLVTEMPEPERYWAQCITAPEKWEVAIKKDAGNDQLSDAEEELIGEIFDTHAEYVRKPFQFVDFLHKNLPEWNKDIPEGSRSPISVIDILKAGNKSEEEINAIHAELKSLSRLQNFVAR